MPKTTINKDSELLIGEGNIWLAYDAIIILFPTVQSHSGEHGKKALFEYCAFAFDGLHCLTSVSGFEIVAHSLAKKVAHWVTHACISASHAQLAGLGCIQQSKKSLAHIRRHRSQ